MNDNAKRWVAALRSGEYAQDRGQLRTATGYCCLGVACDLYARDHSVSWKEEVSGYSFLECEGVLPNAVSDWLGLCTDDGYYCSEGLPRSLAGDNDAGHTFGFLAAVIESDPPGLFV